MPPLRLDIPPCPSLAVERLERELGVGSVLAQVLVRRGFAEPGAARSFLAADESHDAGRMEGIERAAGMILRHARAGNAITVHGDYDVDGVCSTALLVRVLRELGARVDWHLPDRGEDGYGLSLGTVQRLAARGTRLLVTVDCGITAVEEVAAARAAGIDVVVSDHHAPRADGALPDAPLVHPAVCGYPCPQLCATAVAYKLAIVLLGLAGRDPAGADEDLDLVALATVADVVPLLGENRHLVRAGLRALATTAKPGLRALMAVAQVAPAQLDARALGFRLAPRINAAGRVQHAGAALELLLTGDVDRAAAVARELDAANVERRHTETRILFEAEAQVAALGERSAYVLAGDGWHPGVIGIVASRIAERHHRPAVLVALDGDGGRGSARSIAGFDLLAGLKATSRHLRRFGGHRAAAGLELERRELERFAAAFVAHADSVLRAEDLLPREQVDAVVSGDQLGIALAEELLQLEPLGAGNGPVALLLPAARLFDPRAMGEGRHVRFTVASGGTRVQAVAFGAGARLPVTADPGEREDPPVDVTFTLELNEWNGVVEPRLVLRHAVRSEPAPITIVGGAARFMAAAWAELDAELLEPSGAALASVGDAAAGVAGGARAGSGAGRSVCDRRDRGIFGTLGALLASGEPVLVVCADAVRRREQLRERIGGFDICSHAALTGEPALARRYRHVYLLDPPALSAEWPACLAGEPPQTTHLGWGDAELRFSEQTHDREYGLRGPLSALYRVLRDSGTACGEALEDALRGDGPQPRSPALAGRLLRVLRELDLVDIDREREAVTVLPPVRTELERSEAFRFYSRRYEEGLRFLRSSTPRAA